MVSLQSTQRMPRPTGIRQGITPWYDADPDAGTDADAARAPRHPLAQSARASKIALFMRNDVRTSVTSTSTSSGESARAFMASR